MHGAAYKHMPAMVEFLAKSAAEVQVWNRKNQLGWTPSHCRRRFSNRNLRTSPPTAAAIRKVMKAAVSSQTSILSRLRLRHNEMIPFIL